MKSRYTVLFLSLVLALALAVPALGGPTNPIASISASVKSTANKALEESEDGAENRRSSAGHRQCGLWRCLRRPENRHNRAEHGEYGARHRHFGPDGG